MIHTIVNPSPPLQTLHHLHSSIFLFFYFLVRNNSPLSLSPSIHAFFGGVIFLFLFVRQSTHPENWSTGTEDKGDIKIELHQPSGEKGKWNINKLSDGSKLFHLHAPKKIGEKWEH